MKKKDKATAFLLEIVNPALGFTYIDSKNQNYIAVTVIVSILKLIFYFGMNEAADFRVKGILLFIIISSIIVGLPSALVSISVINKTNKKIDEENNLKKEKESKIKKENEFIELSKYSSQTFIYDLKKIYNLNKNSLLTDEELKVRKEAILKKIDNYGIKDNVEDFLISILVLKEDNILTKDEIINIKNKVL